MSIVVVVVIAGVIYFLNMRGHIRFDSCITSSRIGRYPASEINSDQVQINIYNTS
jgi:hypothetical protein